MCIPLESFWKVIGFWPQFWQTTTVESNTVLRVISEMDGKIDSVKCANFLNLTHFENGYSIMPLVGADSGQCFYWSGFFANSKQSLQVLRPQIPLSHLHIVGRPVPTAIRASTVIELKPARIPYGSSPRFNLYRSQPTLPYWYEPVPLISSLYPISPLPSPHFPRLGIGAHSELHPLTKTVAPPEI